MYMYIHIYICVAHCNYTITCKLFIMQFYMYTHVFINTNLSLPYNQLSTLACLHLQMSKIKSHALRLQMDTGRELIFLILSVCTYMCVHMKLCMFAI